MALTQIGKEGITGISNSANANAITIDSGENVALSGTLGVTGAITGTLATAAQTNITSVGTLTSFRSTGIDDNADATAITITSAEKVGLGIDPSTLPSFISHAMKIVNGGGLSITSPSSSDNRYIFFGTGTSSSDVQLAAIKNSNSELMFLGAAGAERMRIDSSGKVGIGTTSPDQPLDIAYTNNTAYSVDNFTNSNNSGLRIENTSTTANAFSNLTFRVGSGADLFFGIEQKSANDGDFIFANQNSPDIEMMRITSGGNVGIGTASPDGTLHVHSASAGSVTANTDADDLVVENSSHAGINILSPDANRSAIQFGHTSDNLKLQIRHDGGTSLSQIISDDALTFNVGGGAERIRVDTSGNVGIGTSSPSVPSGTALEIYGSSASRLKLSNSTTGTRISCQKLEVLIDDTGSILEFTQGTPGKGGK